MKIVFTIATDNAAFGDAPDDRLAEVYRVAREGLDRVYSAPYTYSLTLRDVNGNNVGAMEVQP